MHDECGSLASANGDSSSPGPANTRSDTIEDALAEQRRNWMEGTQTPVAERLRHEPALAADAPRAAELIYHEFLLRGELGETIDWDQYLASFPQYVPLLIRLREADQILDEALRAPRAMRRLPGSFRDYEILEELGRGGMGVVYKARQKSLGRTVAIKMLRRGETSSAQERKRFEREARAVAQLSHPNIVQIYEVGEVDGQPYFSQEFVDGQSLEALLAGTPTAARQAAALVETLAQAMHAAHEKGIVHRDLKPSNVLVAGTLDARALKVTDFGVAKSLDRGTETRTDALLGTPSYMAPEQITDKPGSIDRRVDVYGLGAILYETITGRPPFRAETPLATLNQVIHAEPARPRLLNPAAPRDLETICLKCLHREPAQRYATAADLADDLRRFMSGQPVRARRVGPIGRTWRWSRRNPALAAVAAWLVVTFVCGLSAIVYQWRQAESARQTAMASDEEAQSILGELVETSRRDPLLLRTPSPESLRKAEDHCRRLLERDPGSLPARIALSNVYLHEFGSYLLRQDLDKATDLCARLESVWQEVEGRPDRSPERQRWLAEATGFRADVANARLDRWSALREYLESADHWNQAIEEDPDNPTLIADSLALDANIQTLLFNGEAAFAVPLIEQTRARLNRELADHSRDLHRRQQLAAACFWLGEVSTHEKRPDRSVPFWRAACGHYRAIAEARPADLVTKFRLAICCLRLMRDQASDPFYREGTALTEEFVRRLEALPGGDWRDFGSVVAECYANLAVAHAKVGRSDLAKETLNRCLRANVPLIEDGRTPPRDALTRISLVNTIARRLWEQKQPELALPLARLSASHCSRYQSSAALEPEFQSFLGQTFLGNANLLTDLKDWDLALQQADMARRAFEDYARAVPDRVDSQQSLADLWHRMAKTQWGAGRRQDALVNFRKSASLQQEILDRHPSQDNHFTASKCYDRLFYFASLAGDVHTAALSLVDREKLWTDNPEKLKEVADDYQSLADQLAARKSLSAAERSDREHCLAESRRARDAAKAAAARADGYKKKTPAQL